MSKGKELWEQVRHEVTAAPIQLSQWSSHAMKTDMKHFLFTFARYKFVMKMMTGTDLSVLELGCNDGLGTMFFEQSGKCRTVVGVDFDKESIRWAKENLTSSVTSFYEGDFFDKTCYPAGKYDVITSLDVIEHIESKDEDAFIKLFVDNLSDDGFAVIGTPSLAMYQHTSEKNKHAHINNYSQERLTKLLKKYFWNVFVFGMNDEILHTGMYPLTAYIMVVCCHKK